MEGSANRADSDSYDSRAVRAILAGSREVCTELYERNLSLIRTIGCRILRGASDTDDFIQDVFLKAFTHLQSFTGSGYFRSWLARIAYTTAFNIRRRRIHEIPVDPLLLAETLPGSNRCSPEEELIRNETSAALRRAVAALPLRYQRVVRLKFFLELSYHDIACVTDLPVGTLKAQLHRAKGMLRREMADPGALCS